MGCGASKEAPKQKGKGKKGNNNEARGAEYAKSPQATKEAWGDEKSADGAHSDREPSHDSGGEAASESPFFNKVKTKWIVMSSFVLHGINSDANQFEAQEESVSNKDKHRVLLWVDEHVQWSVQSSVAASCKGVADGTDKCPPLSMYSGPSRAWLLGKYVASPIVDVPGEAITPEEPDFEVVYDAETDPSLLPCADLATIIDVQKMGNLCNVGMDDPNLRKPLAAFLREKPIDANRKKFEGLDLAGAREDDAADAASQLDGRSLHSPSGSLRSPNGLLGGMESARSLKSTASSRFLIERTLTREHLKAHSRAVGKVVKEFYDTLKKTKLKDPPPQTGGILFDTPSSMKFQQQILGQVEASQAGGQVEKTDKTQSTSFSPLGPASPLSRSISTSTESVGKGEAETGDS